MPEFGVRSGLNFDFFLLTQHVSLQLSYHLGLFLLICKERGINSYLEGYWGRWRENVFQIHSSVSARMGASHRVSLCVVPRTPASESLKMQILRVTLGLISFKFIWVSLRIYILSKFPRWVYALWVWKSLWYVFILLFSSFSFPLILPSSFSPSLSPFPLDLI